MTLNMMLDVRMENSNQLLCGIKLLMVRLCEDMILQADH